MSSMNDVNMRNSSRYCNTIALAVNSAGNQEALKFAACLDCTGGTSVGERCGQGTTSVRCKSCEQAL